MDNKTSEFKLELLLLLEKYDYTIGVRIEGDTHGTHDDFVIENKTTGEIVDVVLNYQSYLDSSDLVSSLFGCPFSSNNRIFNIAGSFNVAQTEQNAMFTVSGDGCLVDIKFLPQIYGDGSYLAYLSYKRRKLKLYAPSEEIKDSKFAAHYYRMTEEILKLFFPDGQVDADNETLMLDRVSYSEDFTRDIELCIDYQEI